MSDSILKKEFKEKDVNRLRNLVTGKYGDNTTIGIGYTKPKEHYIEGDIWEENGRTWTIKNNIKQNITKLDKAKQGINVPLFCPNCHKSMKPHLDKEWYIRFNRCFNCQVDFEFEIRKNNKWEEYTKEIDNSHIDGVIKDFKIWSEELINTKENFITEDGAIEKWDGDGKQQLLKNQQETIKYLQSLKKQ